MSKTTITTVRFDPKLSFKSAKVYIDGDNAVDKALDKWFDNNEIWKLKYKSKAWTFLTNWRNKIYAWQIRGAMQLSNLATVNFSGKCGCSCGCSPGFNVKDPVNLPEQYRKHNVWAAIDSSVVDEAILKAVIKMANEILKQELKQHNV